MDKLRFRFVIGLAVLLSTAWVAQASTPSDNSNKQSGNSSQVSQANEEAFPATWTFTNDQSKNSVRLTASSSDPMSTKAARDASGRKPFQARMALSPQGEGFQGVFLPIPAGKRLVIEHISAIARCPEGLRMEINFFSYLDNGDGIGSDQDITFHRITLTDQGTFLGTAIANANHKVLIFADEQIGTTHFAVGVQARLNGSTTGFTQAQVTFSGYLEDLPTAP